MFGLKVFVTIVSCLKDTMTLGTRSGDGLTLDAVAALFPSSMLLELLRSRELELAEVTNGVCGPCRVW